MRVQVLLAVLVFFASLGCAVERINVTKTTKADYSPTDATDVEILLNRPERPFIELATVGVTGVNVNDTKKMHDTLRAKAASLGADAIVIMNQGIAKRYIWVTGVVIRYKTGREAD
jgi:hypothetical protein